MLRRADLRADRGRVLGGDAPAVDAAGQVPHRPRAGGGRRPVRVELARADLELGAVRHADAARASVLIIELDTPGGLVTSTRDISSAILGAQTPVFSSTALRLLASNWRVSGSITLP